MTKDEAPGEARGRSKSYRSSDLGIGALESTKTIQDLGKELQFDICEIGSFIPEGKLSWLDFQKDGADI